MSNSSDTACHRDLIWELVWTESDKSTLPSIPVKPQESLAAMDSPDPPESWMSPREVLQFHLHLEQKNHPARTFHNLWPLTSGAMIKWLSFCAAKCWTILQHSKRWPEQRIQTVHSTIQWWLCQERSAFSYWVFKLLHLLVCQWDLAWSEVFPTQNRAQNQVASAEASLPDSSTSSIFWR